MVRVSNDSLDRLDDLVECGLDPQPVGGGGLPHCRRESRLAANLFEKIAEQTRVIRQAKDRLKELLKDEELPRKGR